MIAHAKGPYLSVSKYLCLVMTVQTFTLFILMVAFDTLPEQGFVSLQLHLLFNHVKNMTILAAVLTVFMMISVMFIATWQKALVLQMLLSILLIPDSFLVTKQMTFHLNHLPIVGIVIISVAIILYLAKVLMKVNRQETRSRYDEHIDEIWWNKI